MIEIDQPSIAVIDYGLGNLRSAEKALLSLGSSARLVSDPAQVLEADGVVLPGVAAFGASAVALRRTGLEEAALHALSSGTPFLGICVGFQLLYEESEESPGVKGLGVFAGKVGRLPQGMKHPQMQWNQLELVGGRPCDLLAGLGDRPWVYFVHSFAPCVSDETVAVCDYGGPISAAAAHRNIWGTQFHPEKSGKTGLAVLANFVERCRAHSMAIAGGKSES